jgi:hypothetical protein
MFFLKFHYEIFASFLLVFLFLFGFFSAVSLYRSEKKALQVTDIAICVMFVILVLGIPLIFTSLTRSAFEVGKLLMLRVFLIAVPGLWLFRTIIVTTSQLKEENDGYSLTKIGRFFWRKTGFEIPLLLWILSTTLSTFFSQNILLSIIGEYDRWEGIITVFNYILLFLVTIKLFQRRYYVPIVFGAMIVATLISAIYGIFQSFGLDFMNWNQNAAIRVFACINNPVHFCAYVGMISPVIIGLLLLIPHKNGSSVPKSSLYFTGFIAIFFASLALYAVFFPIHSIGFFTFLAFLLLIFLGAYYCRESIVSLRSHWTFFGFLAGCLLLSFLNTGIFSGPEWLFFSLATAVSFSYASLPDWRESFRRVLFFSLLIIFYSQILSFSRSTFVGFSVSLPLFFLFSTHTFTSSSKSRYFLDILCTLVLMGSFILLYTFRLFTMSTFLGYILTILLVLALILLYIFNVKKHTLDKASLLDHSKKGALVIVSLAGLLMILFGSVIMPSFPTYFIFLYFLLFLIPQLFMPISSKAFISFISIIIYFSTLQFSGLSFINFFTQLTLTVSYLLTSDSVIPHSNPLKPWRALILLGFLLVMIIPTLPVLNTEIVSVITTFSWASLLGLLCLFSFILWFYYEISRGRTTSHSLLKKGLVVLLIFASFVMVSFAIKYQPHTDSSSELSALQNITMRSQKYEGELEGDGNARVAMWKGSLPWIKDHFFIGSGLDTVKYMFPLYRRPEYGILEGGHHLTPDRLHNEYINTLATKGVVGFILYYGVVIGFSFYFILTWIFKNRHNPYLYCVIGTSTGALLYLVQVLFNFGVVATLTLFYLLLCFSIAMSYHKDFRSEEKTT